jgi:hypothetical protein
MGESVGELVGFLLGKLVGEGVGGELGDAVSRVKPELSELEYPGLLTWSK